MHVTEPQENLSVGCPYYLCPISDKTTDLSKISKKRFIRAFNPSSTVIIVRTLLYFCIRTSILH
jgi:hypothetical protein